MISVVCSFLQHLLHPSNYEALECWFVSCFTFGVGMGLTEVDGIDYRKNFSNWWKNEMKTIKYPSKGTIFDYFVNENRMEEWLTIVDTL
jgi:dynein heavy chain